MKSARANGSIRPDDIPYYDQVIKAGHDACIKGVNCANIEGARIGENPVTVWINESGFCVDKAGDRDHADWTKVWTYKAGAGYDDCAAQGYLIAALNRKFTS